MDNTLGMTEQMRNELDKFFAGKTIQDIDRSSFLVCNLVDKRIKITISLVFMRDWDSLETDSYNSVIIENKGVVFTFPGYWVSIPKELAMTYFEYIINDFYQSTVSEWSIASGLTGGSDSNGTGCDCNCPPANVTKIATPPCSFANI